MCPPLTTINPYNVRFVSGHQHHICILLCRAQHFYLRRDQLSSVKLHSWMKLMAARYSYCRKASDRRLPIISVDITPLPIPKARSTQTRRYPHIVRWTM